MTDSVSERTTAAEKAAAEKAAAAEKTAGKAARRRGRAARALRVTGAAAVLAVTAGVAAAGTVWSPHPGAQSLPLSVAVPPTQVALVCPGAPTSSAIGSSDVDLGGASTFVSQVRGTVMGRAAAPAAAVLTDLARTSETALAGGDAAVSATIDAAAGATVLRAEPESSAAAYAVAGVASRADSGDLRGLAATSCPAAASTLWFAAGRTSVGDSSVLTLRNAGSTAATVTLRVWGETGEVALTATPIVVAPGTEVVQPMEAIAPDVDRLVVQATARGGQVSATMQTLQLDGLTPNGTDLVGGTAGPTTTSVIPGVVLGSSVVGEADPSLVRIMNPGDQPATVSLELLGADSPIYLSSLDGIVVEAGAVTDVSLAGAPAGSYALRVTADSPVVTGASLVRTGAPAPEDPDVPVVERAWLTSVTPSLDSAAAVPGLGSVADRAVLVIGDGVAADQADEGEFDADAPSTPVVVTGYDGAGAVVATSELVVPASGSVAVDLASLSPALATVRVSAERAVSSAVVLTYPDALGELLSVLPAQPDPQVERSVAVRVSLG